MALSEQLLKKLVCPDCHGKLIYRQEDNRLDCQKSGLSFKIIDDIPVLLVDEAEPLK
jgi:uncharacterized protein YbaR (Trm112 family)